MSQIKMIASDLDNTLLNSKKEISEYTKQVLEQAHERGIIFVPATGRALNGIPIFLKEIPGIRYAILCNGASVYDFKEEKFVVTNYFKPETALSIVKKLDHYRCSRDIYQRGKGVMEKKYLNTLEDYKIERPIAKLVRKTRTPVDDLEQYISNHGTGIEKISAFFGDLDEREKVKKDMLTYGKSTVVSSLYNNLELSAVGCDKGNGLEGLAAYLHLSMDQVIAFGDAGNDIGMIRAAGTGVAVENALPEVKAIADCIVETNEEDGVAKAICQYAF